MDIDSIVAKMMRAERVPLDKLEQKKQILEWQQEDYRALNTTLYEFRTNAFDIRLERTFMARTAASSDEGAVTATAGANAADGTYAIKVNQLATGVSKASTADLAPGKNPDGSSKTLWEQFGVEFESGLRGALTETSCITVNINGTDLEFELGVDNLTTVAAKINEADLGVKASYDTSLNRFFLNSSSTGSDAEITITDSANFFSKGVNSSLLNLNIDDGISYTGQNASIDFGDAVGLVSATNAITVNGITFDLKDAGSSSITVTRNIEGVIDSVTKFIDTYNTTLKTLYDKVQADRNRDFPPLTKAQRDSMSDSEIAKWEEKARSGLLRTDEKLKSTINSYRYIMSGIVADVDGPFNTLSSIGIKSEPYDNSGKLIIDKDVLREALTKDPDSVKELFTKTSSVDNEQGVAAKLYDTTLKGITYLVEKVGSESSPGTVDSSYIGKQLTKLGKEIERWEEKLVAKEDKHYAKFTAMEKAIYKMNTQSAWLTSMLGPGS